MGKERRQEGGKMNERVKKKGKKGGTKESKIYGKKEEKKYRSK